MSEKFYKIIITPVIACGISHAKLNPIMPPEDIGLVSIWKGCSYLMNDSVGSHEFVSPPIATSHLKLLGGLEQCE